jgi:hypothetical protein
VYCLAVLARRMLSGELQPSSDPGSLFRARLCCQQLLDCTVHFLEAVYDTDFSSGGAVSCVALELAKQINVAELCPALADAASQAAQKILSAEKQQQLGTQQQQEQELRRDQVDAMHNGAAGLRLVLAVAAVWPGGTLKSSTARCLAGGSCKGSQVVLGSHHLALSSMLVHEH